MKISIFKKKLAEKIIAAKEAVHLISAGAGTGKTTFLKYLVRLIRKGNPKARILFLGFANKTVQLGEEKIGDSTAEFLTCHQFAYRIIREHSRHSIKSKDIRFLGYNRPIQLTAHPSVIEAHIQLAWFRDIAKRLGLDAKAANQALDYLNRCYAERRTLDARNPDVKKLICLYAQQKTAIGSIDFNDMVVFAWALMKQHSSVRNNIQKCYDYILVDEIQDMNLFQWEMIRWSLGPRTKLVMVGDPCQLAYGFLGASLGLFGQIEAAYRNNIQCHSLQVSLRCPGPIAALSNAITKSSKIPGRTTIRAHRTRNGDTTSVLVFHRTPDSGTAYVANQIKEFVQGDRSYSDVVILFRVINSGRKKTKMFSQMVKELKQHNIPFTYRDRYEKEASKYKSYAHVLRVAARQFDSIDLRTVIMLLKGIGPYHAGRIVKQWGKNRDMTATKLVQALQAAFFQSNWSKTIQEITKIVRRHKKLDDEVLKFFSGLSSVVDLQESNLSDRISNHLAGRNAVTLSTIHGFKGDERKVVFLLGIEDDSLPHAHTRNEDEDQERCLMNIAVTRSSEKLVMTCWNRGARMEANISRFLRPLLGQDFFKLEKR